MQDNKSKLMFEAMLSSLLGQLTINFLPGDTLHMNDPLFPVDLDYLSLSTLCIWKIMCHWLCS